jgi:hypothetical protein
MIGRSPGPTWNDLRKGDVLISRLGTKNWCVVIVLEDAPSDQAGTTRAFRIFDDVAYPEARQFGASKIRADKGEIDLKMWELIRAR